MLKTTDKPSKAPQGWEGMYACDLSDARSLAEYGGVYATNLTEIVAWLKANGFTMNGDDISGTYDNKRCIAMIWHRGTTVAATTISKEWNKRQRKGISDPGIHDAGGGAVRIQHNSRSTQLESIANTFKAYFAERKAEFNSQGLDAEAVEAHRLGGCCEQLLIIADELRSVGK